MKSGNHLSRFEKEKTKSVRTKATTNHRLNRRFDQSTTINRRFDQSTTINPKLAIKKRKSAKKAISLMTC